ncbi:MAG: cellulase family glycosylhydrolase [Pyrinomonadaceae bacterium]
MSINLTRDSSGRILSNGTPIILRGGHYYIFKDDDRPEKSLVTSSPEQPLPRPESVGVAVPLRVEYQNKPPCQQPNPDLFVRQTYWTPEPWSVFSYLRQSECNFLRIWLTGGTLVSGDAEAKPLDLTPFVSVKVGNKWKWKVYDAVVSNIWNEEYFRRLNAFVTAAENAGIVIQISLFNYFDLTDERSGNFRTWCRSPWNPSMSEHPATIPNWGNDHLVNAGSAFACSEADSDANIAARQKYFLAPNNYLRQVQQALVTKTVKTLLNRTNVIYEIMNEPRGIAKDRANFCSTVVDWIVSAAGAKRPLISINTSNANDGVFDIDYWRDKSVRNYDRIDAVSYHGMTGFPQTKQKICDDRPNMDAWAVDLKSVQSRFNAHQSRHGSKSLIYCTDAVRLGIHKFVDTSGNEYILQIRDGQIYTNYANVNSDPPQVQIKTSDLQNWAFWCFSVSVAYPGKVHFQNHSLNPMSYPRIKEAMGHAMNLP